MRHGTYSIVALDPQTGELGAAVQSHWFSVGSLCTWARAGIGAVATQSVVEPAYGPDALDRLADGIGAQQALGELLAADPLAAVRQVAVVDSRGGVAVPTGEDCIPCAGPFGAAEGGPPEGPIAAQDAAGGGGGGGGGRQSAAMLVVAAEGEPWRT